MKQEKNRNVFQLSKILPATEARAIKMKVTPQHPYVQHAKILTKLCTQLSGNRTSAARWHTSSSGIPL